jgi:CheY-like chemotaxis protein
MKRVLIIEDNEDNMFVLEAFLEDTFELLKAYDGIEGLQKTIDEKPDLVLLDISLPKMDGTEAIAKIRQNETTKNIPVIALTAHAMMGDREKFLDFGFDEYMSKPIVDEDALIKMMKSLMER